MSKFKKDDKVRCILSSKGEAWNNAGRMDYLLKGVHTVSKRLYGEDRFEIDSWSLRDYEFELANKFKVGDQIIGNATNNHSITNKTNISTVVKVIDEIHIKVTVKDSTSEFSVMSSKFDLCVPKNTIEHKFAIGEEIINQWGQKRTIKNIRVMYTATSGANYFEDDLTKVPEEVITEVTMADLEAKYGTKVKVIK